LIPGTHTKSFAILAKARESREEAIMRVSLLHAFGSYLQSQTTQEEGQEPQQPSVTISRQTGSGAVTIAQMLAERLNVAAKPPVGATSWTVFDRNLARQVLVDHKLPLNLERFMIEDARLPVEAIVEEVLGLHPSPWTLAQQTTRTILRLAGLGRVIVVGRGAEIITNRLPYVFHVRLVAPLEQRIQHAVKYYNLDAGEAAKFVKEEDHARRRYLRRYFDADVDDPLLYDLVLNTGRLGFARATQIVAQAVLRHHEEFLHGQPPLGAA
jgi:cytidylate kinase